MEKKDPKVKEKRKTDDPPPELGSKERPWIHVKPPKHVKNKYDVHNAKLNYDLPQFPFCIQIVGPRYRGKSVVARHMLQNKPDEKLYGCIFKPSNMIFISPTLDEDTTFKDIPFEYRLHPEQISVVGEIMSIINQQKEHKKSNNDEPVLIVLDDITQVRDAWKALEKLGYIGRHANLHTIAIAHKMSSIIRGVRTAIQQWMIFEPHEQSEWEWILGMFSRKKTQHIWVNALRRAWDIPHNFVMIDFERKDPNQVYKSGFHEPLFTPEEIAMMNSQEEPGKNQIFYNPDFKVAERSTLSASEKVEINRSKPIESEEDDDPSPIPPPKKKRKKKSLEEP